MAIVGIAIGVAAFVALIARDRKRKRRGDAGGWGGDGWGGDSDGGCDGGDGGGCD